MEIIKMTREEWEAEGKKRFGENFKNWKFKCPVCKYVASAEDYLAANAPESHIGISCIGRSIPDEVYKAFGSNKKGVKKGPCDYAGYGLFQLNPIEIIGENIRAFEFA
jgi:hypothetical protein